MYISIYIHVWTYITLYNKHLYNKHSCLYCRGCCTLVIKKNERWVLVKFFFFLCTDTRDLSSSCPGLTGAIKMPISLCALWLWVALKLLWVLLRPVTLYKIKSRQYFPSNFSFFYTLLILNYFFSNHSDLFIAVEMKKNKEVSNCLELEAKQPLKLAPPTAVAV